MAAEFDYKIEKYEEYFGDEKQVKKIIDHCKVCGAKMVHTHLSDYKNLIVKETTRCTECGGGNRKLIHILN